ncbi:cytochrome P450, partial [Martensiomyces pterosporus]
MLSLVALVLILALLKVVYERWVTPLSRVPGRLVHSVTSIPMRYHMVRGTLPEFLLQLHQQFGPVVRISPQRVSVADPGAVRHVLSTHYFPKTPSYDMPAVLQPNAFSTRSAELSTERRRQIGPGFSHWHLALMQDEVVACAATAVRHKLDGMLGEGGGRESVVVDIHRWFSLIALDAIGVVGFGRQFGALERGAHKL